MGQCRRACHGSLVGKLAYSHSNAASFSRQRADDRFATAFWTGFAPYALHFGGGCIVPKADGSISVGATSERAGFDKTVTAEGISKILSVQKKMVPALNNARFLRAWAGLRPGSADDLPLIGPSQSAPGLWIAGGHFRDGILLGPLTGSILAELLQGHPIPSGLDLTPFDPDRFGGWNRTTNNDPGLHLPQ